MRGVHASLNHIAASIVIICVAVSIVIIIVVWIVAAEAEAASEAAVMVEAATRFAATETTVMERHAAAECARAEATMEATTAKAAGVETSATTKAAATASVSAAAASAFAATARQRHGWRGQTNRRNRQQRDHCFTQHCHSPSEISLPTSTLVADGNRSGETLRASTSLLLNSAREIKLKFSKRWFVHRADVIELKDRIFDDCPGVAGFPLPARD
jgi:hypothetical protein